MKGFTTKRTNQKKHSYVSFVSERREQSQRYSYSAGFTLVETMVAITILTLSIAGPLTTASRAIVAAEVSRDQLTASYLAQEGLEYMRSVRDGSYLTEYKLSMNDPSIEVTSVSWNAFLTSVTSCRPTTPDPTIACTFDPAAYSLTPCHIGSCLPLHLVNTGSVDNPINYYTTNSSLGSTVPATVFTRTIQVFDVAGTDADKRIVSTVSWSFHNTPYTVTVTDHLTSWQ